MNRWILTVFSRGQVQDPNYLLSRHVPLRLISVFCRESASACPLALSQHATLIDPTQVCRPSFAVGPTHCGPFLSAGSDNNVVKLAASHGEVRLGACEALRDFFRVVLLYFVNSNPSSAQP